MNPRQMSRHARRVDGFEVGGETSGCNIDLGASVLLVTAGLRLARHNNFQQYMEGRDGALR